MAKEIMVKSVNKWNSNTSRPKLRPNIRWNDDTVNDLKVVKVSN